MPEVSSPDRPLKKLKTSDVFLSDITTPAFVVNKHAMTNNCRKVLETAAVSGMKLRPHIKTHKTIEGALIQSNPYPEKSSSNDDESNTKAIVGFVASTIPELTLLLENSSKYGGPFNDVLYGVPISEYKLKVVSELIASYENAKIHIMIDHLDQVKFIEKFCSSNDKGNPVKSFSAFLKLDTGYHRAGVSCDDRGIKLGTRILVSPNIQLQGFYSHCGHSYDVNSSSELESIANEDLSKMADFATSLTSHATGSGISAPKFTMSIGSTPSTFSVNKDEAKKTNGNDSVNHLEMHPGNYTFFDRQQMWVGVCNEKEVACRVMSRVIGHYEERNTIMLDVGSTALTKDTSPQGGVCSISGYPDLECFKLSQECMLVKPKDASIEFPYESFPLGKIVSLVPNHSCLAAACFDKYYVIDDENQKFDEKEKIIDEWIPVKGW